MDGDPVCLQKTMEPKALAARFIATHHRRRFRETQAGCGLGYFIEQALCVTCCHGAFAWVVTMARGATELPRFFTQLEGHKQSRLRCAIMRVVGRCGHHGFAPPWGKV